MPAPGKRCRASACSFTVPRRCRTRNWWPSFWAALDPAKVRLIEDRSHGMVRVEARCSTCDAHLGHVFPDGPRPTGERFCMNSASLDFVPAQD